MVDVLFFSLTLLSGSQKTILSNELASRLTSSTKEDYDDSSGKFGDEIEAITRSGSNEDTNVASPEVFMVDNELDSSGSDIVTDTTIFSTLGDNEVPTDYKTVFGVRRTLAVSEFNAPGFERVPTDSKLDAEVISVTDNKATASKVFDSSVSSVPDAERISSDVQLGAHSTVVNITADKKVGIVHAENRIIHGRDGTADTRVGHSIKTKVGTKDKVHGTYGAEISLDSDIGRDGGIGDGVKIRDGGISDDRDDGIGDGAKTRDGGIGDGAKIKDGGISDGVKIRDGGIGDGAKTRDGGISDDRDDGIGDGAKTRDGGIGDGAKIKDGGISDGVKIRDGGIGDGAKTRDGGISDDRDGGIGDSAKIKDGGISDGVKIRDDSIIVGDKMRDVSIGNDRDSGTGDGTKIRNGAKLRDGSIGDDRDGDIDDGGIGVVAKMRDGGIGVVSRMRDGGIGDGRDGGIGDGRDDGIGDDRDDGIGDDRDGGIGDGAKLRDGGISVVARMRDGSIGDGRNGAIGDGAKLRDGGIGDDKDGGISVVIKMRDGNIGDDRDGGIGDDIDGDGAIGDGAEMRDGSIDDGAKMRDVGMIGEGSGDVYGYISDITVKTTYSSIHNANTTVQDDSTSDIGNIKTSTKEDDISHDYKRRGGIQRSKASIMEQISLSEQLQKAFVSSIERWLWKLVREEGGKSEGRAISSKLRTEITVHLLDTITRLGQYTYTSCVSLKVFNCQH